MKKFNLQTEVAIRRLQGLPKFAVGDNVVITGKLMYWIKPGSRCGKREVTSYHRYRIGEKCLILSVMGERTYDVTNGFLRQTINEEDIELY